MGRAPLEGVRVVDVSQMLSGPVCTQMLGDLGADVIKVEPIWGDRQRRGPVPIDGQTSHTFLAFNRSKRAICLDLSTDEGQQVMSRLVESADVFIQNLSRRAVEDLGLSYERLGAVNPRLVYASVFGYGDKGPFRDLPGQDLQLQAFSGLASITGYSNETRPSTPAGGTVSDVSAGILIAFGIAAALYDRERTGRGREVKTSLLAGTLLVQEPLFSTFLSTGQLPRKAENGHPMSPPPFGIWKAADGKELAISGNRDPDDWLDFCAIIGRPEIAEDPRFATNEARMENIDALFEIIAEALTHETRDEWLRLLSAAGFWVTRVCDYEELCASSHLRDNDLLVDMEHPSLGRYTTLSTPVAFNDLPTETKRRPPLLGEHTREVLAELGYDGGTIDSLYEAGVVA